MDDHIETNELLCRFLRRAGYTARPAFDGKSGLQIALATQPDLIILDQMMPGMDGIQVLRILRENSATARIPVVMYSAVADPAFASQAMSMGATSVWLKGSVSPATIPSSISTLLA